MAKPTKKVYNLPQPSSNLSGPMRGHVAVKSGPFASTCTRLGNQGMIQDQMNTHYKKLNKAKSCIDAGPPKSMTLSVKKRDQVRREAMMKSPKTSSPASSRPSSRATVRPDSARQGSPSRQALDQSFMSAELNHLAVDGRLTPTPYTLSQRSTANHDRPPRPQSRLSETSRSLRFKDTNTPRLTETERLRSERMDQIRPASGDILDRMSGRFSTLSKPHTPRTLNTTAKSRLAQSRNYNKPKKATVETSPQQNGIVNEEKYDDYEQTIQDYENRINEDDEGDEQANDLPKRNQDHVRWVEDQARRVESLHLGQLEEGSDGEDGYGLGLSQSHRRPFYSTGNLSNRPLSRTSQRMKDEEEELRYLEFVTDVTNDVLNRGIFTNRVLKQVFDSHISRNKDRLDEARMRHLMAQLQEDLFIPNSENENEDDEEAAKDASR